MIKKKLFVFGINILFNPCNGEEVTGKNIRPCKLYLLEERKEGLFLGMPEAPPLDDFSF